MNTTTKKNIIIVLVLLTIVAIFLIANNTKHDRAITIGAIYTLSGQSADIGKALQEGTEIALEEINQSGGIKGGSVKIIFEDAPDQAAKPTVNAGQKLMTVDKVLLILDMPYAGPGGLQNLVREHQIPVIDIIDSSDEIASYNDWIFGSGIYANGVGAQVAEFTKNALKLQKVGMLVGREEYVEAVANGFEKEFIRLGGTIVGKENFLIGNTDFRTQAAKLIVSNVEGIFVSHLGEAGYVVKQATELGYSGIFLGSDTFSIADVQNVAGEALDGRTYFALWRNFDSATTEQQAFVERYKTKYGKEPGDYLFYNVLGYDGMMVAAEALKSSDLSGESIKDALYKIKDFPGLSGPITIDETGINRDPKSAIVMYKEGKIVRYQE